MYVGRNHTLIQWARAESAELKWERIEFEEADGSKTQKREREREGD